MKRTVLFYTLVFLLAQGTAWSQIPQTMSYQGILKDAAGVVVTDGNYQLTFKIYDVVTAGTELWTESQSVAVSDGIFSAILGSITSLNLDFDKQYWLGVTVGIDAELTPRTQLTASPYSLNARSVLGSSNTFPSSGNVGIGTTSPASKLDVSGAISGFGVVPIGSIIAWHKNLSGTPSLPDGWIECNGQTLNDPASPYNGQTIPDLNGDARFLRGGSTSGIEQDDAFEDHVHSGGGAPLGAAVSPGSFGSPAKTSNTGSAITGTPGTETRPINMSIVWIIRVK